MKQELPLIKEITYHDPLKIFAQLQDRAYAIFLDSALENDPRSQYSYIAVDPFAFISVKNDKIFYNGELIAENLFNFLRKLLILYKTQKVNGVPAFQGGIAGYFAYDLCRYLEDIPSNAIDDLQFPDMAVGIYDAVLAYDHLVKKCYIISTGFPEIEQEQRLMRAQERSEWLLSLVKLSSELELILATPLVSLIKSNFTQEQYIAALEKVIEYIYAGDIFEVNIAQRFEAELPDNCSPFEIYRRLRFINPAPFAAYLNFGDTILASASPERFIRLYDNQIETRPIKGTRPRGKTAEEDKQYANELIVSVKDQAENIMIVDLMRNDLSKVCIEHSIKVPQLCGLESYASVHHLVSVVTGQLDARYNTVDVLKATFPGGSITGAPKIRAMEIIDEIEPHRRGPYCGSIGYISFNGDMDTSIIIRTFCIKNNIISFHAGGAIVADSNPQEEYEETLVKARSLRKALTESL